MTRAPLFDLVLMGVGPDGHNRIAVSRIFPRLRRPHAGSSACHAPMSSRLFPASALHCPRSASLPTKMLFEVAGAGKRAILTRVLAGENLPAGRASSIGETVWA